MISIYKIDSLLRDISKLYLQNPDLPVISDTMYSILMNYGLSKEEINKNIDTELSSVYQQFKNSNIIHSYVDNRQSQFLQMRSYSVSDTKFIKMYMSFPKEYISVAAKKIFTFIEQNNMYTASKISRKLRSDSIVIRLKNVNDAKKLINYINSDKELNSYTKDTNPFSFQNGNIGFGYDNLLSYSKVVSDILESYFSELKNNNNLSKASYQTFKEYVTKYYDNTFRNLSNLNNLTKSEDFNKKLGKFNSKGECINNYEQVTRLIKSYINNELTLDTYFEFYNDCLNDKKNKDMSNYYEEISNNRINKLNNNSININNTNSIQVLNEYIDLAIKKYGLNDTIQYLNMYISGNKQAITRTNDLRNKFINNLSPQKLLQLTNNNISEYVSKHVNKNNTVENNYILFVNACLATLKKYNDRQLEYALLKAMTGDYSSFTNGNMNYRNKLKLIPKEHINDYLKMYLVDNGYNIENNDIVSSFCSILSNSNQNTNNYSK